MIKKLNVTRIIFLRTYAKRSAGQEKTNKEEERQKDKEDLDLELWEGEWREMDGSGDGADPFMVGEDILPLQFSHVQNKNIKVCLLYIFYSFLFHSITYFYSKIYLFVAEKLTLVALETKQKKFSELLYSLKCQKCIIVLI